MDCENISITTEQSVTTAEIQRPDALNALNKKTLEELTYALDQAVQNNSRAFIIKGQGRKAFVAGADIAEMQGYTPSQMQSFSQCGHKLTKALEESPLVTIAVVQGFALGGGCELAIACDLILASEKAVFGQPEASLGLVPGFGATQRLTKILPPHIARDLLLTGRTLNGTEAYQFGLASRVCHPDKLEETLEAVVRAVKAYSPTAIAKTKELCLSSQDTPLKQGLDLEACEFAVNSTQPEAVEGMKAFLEKRRPSFSL